MAPKAIRYSVNIAKVGAGAFFSHFEPAYTSRSGNPITPILIEPLRRRECPARISIDNNYVFTGGQDFK